MMVESDHSETEEDMDTLQLSSDSVDVPTNKRQRVVDSEDEQDLPAKKRRNSSGEKSEILKKNGTEVVPDKNGTDENTKEENNAAPSENKQSPDEKSLSDPRKGNGVKQEDTILKQEDKIIKQEDKIKQDDKIIKQDDKIIKQDDKIIKQDDEIIKQDDEIIKQDDEIIKQENVSGSPVKDKDNSTTDDSPTKTKTEEDTESKKDSPIKELGMNTDTASISENEKVVQEDEIINKADEPVDEEEKSKEDKLEKKRTKKRTVDTEVVDGLELSVECESDREPSSENEDQKDTKPRPKTIIVKAKPNDSELECSSSQEEKSDSQEAIDTVENKPERKKWKRRGPRTSFSKLKASGSEDSHNNNSDEDYSPRTKKKMKKSPMTKRSAKRFTESKRGRGGGARRNSRRSTEDISNGENTDAISTDRTNTQTKNKEEAKEDLSEKESLASNSGSISNSEDEEKPVKGRRGRRSNVKPEDNKQIQALKKYLSVAGVKIRSYSEIWANCKTNTARINRLKELLEKNGVRGRPTLEKCKRAKEDKEKMQEVSELDTSNIISEGRVTRARRNMNSGKKTSVPNESPRHREARNTLKRIQTVIDSDSE